MYNCLFAQGTFTLAPFEFIVNGDFSQGNKGFFSDYIDASLSLPPDLSPEGNYMVTDNPHLIYVDLSSCVDHTTGAGNMLVTNGNLWYNKVVWGQVIKNIQPNTDYLFSVWYAMAHPRHQAQMETIINKQTIQPDIIFLPPDTCVWHNCYFMWNSGTFTSATITMYDRNVEPAGNDFLVDDISFKTICTLQADAGTDKDICAGGTTLIGNPPLNGFPPFTYQWSPATGLDNPNIQSPTVTVNQTTTYYLQVTDSINCVSFDTVVVNLVPFPPTIINTDKPTSICPCDSITLSATSGYTYLWSTGDTTQSIKTNLQGKYFCTISNQNLCSVLDSIEISLINPVTTISIDTVFGKVGDNVTIPVKILPPFDENCSMGMFGTVIEYDKSLLFLVSTVDSSEIIGKNQRIYFRKSENGSLLEQLKFVATLGSSECTDISFVTFNWDCPLSITNTINGRFCLTNVCTEPTPRLFDESVNFYLKQNSPNPVSESTLIELALPDNSPAELYIVNILGEKVKSLAKYSNRGVYRIVNDLSDLSDGIYFYVLQNSYDRLTKRLVICK